MKLAEVFKLLKGPIRIEKVRCQSTGFTVEGPFTTPALFQIDEAHLRLVESLVIHGGNLKRVAEEMDISYPTLKNRLDEIGRILKADRSRRSKQRIDILEQIERGEITSEEGSKELKSL